MKNIDKNTRNDQIVSERYISNDGQQMKYRYYDKNGVEITCGCKIYLNEENTEETVYDTDDGYLGIDATSKAWLASGRAFPCQYGIYILNDFDMSNAEVLC